METVVKNKLYEGMFLVDSALAGADWDGVIATIRTILEKAETEIVSIQKWDERKLAYEIKGKARGTYILCYFRANGERIRDIEKAVHLSEQIIRVLILSAERLKPEDIEKDTPAIKAEKEKDKRKVPKETTQRDETEQLSVQEEEAETVEEVEQFEETQQIKEEETEDSQALEASVVAEDSMEKQPEQDKPESPEEADKPE